MNNKIIGFTICAKEIDHSDVDIFNSGIVLTKIATKRFFIYFWGFGDLKKCFLSENRFSLSFPLTDSLDDRNVIIEFSEEKIEVSNDWLGSIPIFYNQQRKIISTLMLKTLDGSTKVDAEGLNNYLNFGYSVLEKTPFTDVNFLKYDSKIILNDGELSVDYKKMD